MIILNKLHVPSIHPVSYVSILRWKKVEKSREKYEWKISRKKTHYGLKIFCFFSCFPATQKIMFSASTAEIAQRI